MYLLELATRPAVGVETRLVMSTDAQRPEIATAVSESWTLTRSAVTAMSAGWGVACSTMEKLAQCCTGRWERRRPGMTAAETGLPPVTGRSAKPRRAKTGNCCNHIGTGYPRENAKAEAGGHPRRTGRTAATSEVVRWVKEVLYDWSCWATLLLSAANTSRSPDTEAAVHETRHHDGNYNHSGSQAEMTRIPRQSLVTTTKDCAAD